MKYADYYDCDICNGNSVGMSLFVSGCPIHCEGCFNPETWDFNYGKDWTPEIEDKFINLAGREYIKRISFLGGSPLCDENFADVSLLIQKLKYHYPDKKIWVYTGYTLDAIMSNEYKRQILSYIDVLVDGSFDIAQKDLMLAFRGSKNQRLIDIQETLKSGIVTLWKGIE